MVYTMTSTYVIRKRGQQFVMENNVTLKKRYPSLSHFRISLYGKRIATDSCLHNVIRGSSLVFQAVSGMLGNKLCTSVKQNTKH